MAPQQYYSNWWYGVIIPPIFEILGWGSLYLFEAAGIINQSETLIVIVISAFGVFGALLLSPVFVICLWLDTRKLSDSDIGWSPSPWLWGVVGLVTVLVSVLSSYSLLMTVVALVYLYRRHSHVGLFRTNADIEGS